MAEQVSPSEPPEQWMSYPELGDRLGISADGARAKAKRAGWQVQLGHDGRARVLVPTAELPTHPPEPEAAQAVLTAERQAGLLTDLRRAYAERVAELIARAERAEQEAEQARAVGERWRTMHAQVQVQLVRAEERVKAAQAVAIADVATARAEIDAQRLLVTELKAELERLRRPWWRR